jgi:hypothetical protein
MLLGDCDGSLNRATMARDDHLAWVIVVGDGADLALRRCGRDGLGLLEVGSEQGRHRPLPNGTAACIAWPRRLSSRAVVERSKLPAAQSALYSPRLCPATNCALAARSMSSVRSTAKACAMIAG